MCVCAKACLQVESYIIHTERERDRKRERGREETVGLDRRHLATYCSQLAACRDEGFFSLWWTRRDEGIRYHWSFPNGKRSAVPGYWNLWGFQDVAAAKDPTGRTMRALWHSHPFFFFFFFLFSSYSLLILFLFSSYSLLIGSKYRTRLVFKRQDDLAVLYMCFSLSLSSFSRLLIHLAVGCITSWKGKKKEEKRAPADDKKTSQTRVKSLGKVSSPPTSLSFFYFAFLYFLSGDLFFFIHWKNKNVHLRFDWEWRIVVKSSTDCTSVPNLPFYSNFFFYYYERARAVTLWPTRSRINENDWLNQILTLTEMGVVGGVRMEWV